MCTCACDFLRGKSLFSWGRGVPKRFVFADMRFPSCLPIAREARLEKAESRGNNRAVLLGTLLAFLCGSRVPRLFWL